MLNSKDIINEYIERVDWRVNANANIDYGLGGLILNNNGKVTAEYWLKSIYDKYNKDIAEFHRLGFIHIHDLDFLGGYCAGWSLRILLAEGFNGVRGKIASKAPRHLITALNQIVNFIGTLQNEWAGAQAFSSFDTYLAPFVRADGLSYKEVEQLISCFVFNLNVPTRWGTQTPFSNITLDWVCPKDIKEQPIFEQLQDRLGKATFGDFQHEMNMINKAFLKVMLKGDGDGRTFTFPIPTYNITKSFCEKNEDVEIEENKKILDKLTRKYGTPYFQNFLNSDLNPEDVRSMCCRLRLDLTQLKKRGGGLFGSAEQTGSIGVVTINMARLGYLAKGYEGDKEEKFYTMLDKVLKVAIDSLEIKREVLNDLLERGLYPYTKRYLGQFDHHFSTIGINGLNECILNFTDGSIDITDDWGQEKAKEILMFIRGKLREAQESTGHMYNLEATPAEGAMYRFAKKDQEMYPDIIQAQGDSDIAPFYTNSSQLPVGYSDDLFECLDLQEELQRQYTGGTVFHMYLGEKINNTKISMLQLIEKVFTKYRIPYFTVSPTFSICSEHGIIEGEHFTCPHCDEKCEVWTRVMGYYRPIENFNLGKKSEQKMRKKINKI